MSFLYVDYDKHNCVPVSPQTFSVCLFKHILLCSTLYFSLGRVTKGEGENTDISKEMELCCHGERFPTGTMGYLPHHCPGTRKYASIICVI